MSVKPTTPTAEAPRGSLSANSEARVSSIDKDADIESLITRGPKKYSLRYIQPPATLRNPGSEDDHRGEIEINISQGVSLTSNTTGFYSINTTEATPDPDPHAMVFDNFRNIQTNDNFDPAQTKDNPISTKKHLPISQQTTYAVKRTFSKPIKHKANQPESSHDELISRD